MISISRAKLPKYLPLKETGSVLQLLGEGAHRWTKGANYRNAEGDALTITPTRLNPPASFDLMGAVHWCYDGKMRDEAVMRIALELGKPPVRWNDEEGTTYTMVMELVKRCNI